MTHKLTFYVARHVADVIRNEPRNVGVIVTDGTHAAARFLGETGPDSLDLRRVPPSVVPDRPLYQEWHRHWRRTLEGTQTVGDALARLVAASTPAFAVQPGGDWYQEADVVSSAAVRRVTDEVFRRVVDQDASPFATEESSSAAPALYRSAARSIELADAIAATFRAENILEQSNTRGLFASYPVRIDQPVMGRNPVPHVPKFVQENGRQYVIEHVDFEVAEAEAAREHSTYAAYMLSDILRAASDAGRAQSVEAIAVVKRVVAVEVRRLSGGAAAALVAAQEYGLAALGEHAGLRVVNWDDQTERARFVGERVAAAHGERSPVR